MIKLEVYETDDDTMESTWVTWLVYHGEEHRPRAIARRDRLISKGYDARVTVAGTVVTDKPVCAHCGDPHPAPFDGSCLL